ncbi:MAG: hypothetical protein M1829_003767 [Trizodia sp. TS-e1964]|nr:MAG: hypothetical protein M1829_003767 [Trizodia sp. TS-e1964]
MGLKEAIRTNNLAAVRFWLATTSRSTWWHIGSTYRLPTEDMWDLVYNLRTRIHSELAMLVFAVCKIRYKWNRASLEITPRGSLRLTHGNSTYPHRYKAEPEPEIYPPSVHCYAGSALRGYIVCTIPVEEWEGSAVERRDEAALEGLETPSGYQQLFGEYFEC